MIGWLAGTVRRRDVRDAVVVLDVAGVGYEVYVASVDDLRVGDLLEVHVHTVVRADAIVLYGFRDFAEREFFELLLATPGVGPSTAMAALRTMSLVELAQAIEDGDAKRVATVPGIGAKTANRIVLELKGKILVDAESPAPPAAGQPREIDEALRSLGYAAVEIREALAGAELPDDEAEALRFALNRLRRS